MRTTLSLDPDVMLAARSLARSLDISIGAAVSELARRGLDRSPPRQAEGLPCFDAPPGSRIITLETVKQIEDEA